VAQPDATLPLTSRRLESPEETRTTQPSATAVVPNQPPPKAAMSPPAQAAAPPPEPKTSKRMDPATANTPQITGEEAASAGREAAHMINKMLTRQRRTDQP
jgi:hypothetical protein